MSKMFRRSPLAMALLGLLFESPMHPYRMQQLIKERGKDRVINVSRRSSLYQTINQLEKAGLIRVRDTQREEKRPERTRYELTDKGRGTLLGWLREALATPLQEFPEFPAALSFMALLPPEDALRQLEAREATLVEKVAEIEADFSNGAGFLPRLFLLEEEYLRNLLAAELNWLRSIIGDLRSGQITWSWEMLREFMSSQGKE